MKALVTGASGFIGLRLTHRLADLGVHVAALYRNRSHLKDLQHANITPVRCDIMSLECMREAIYGCDECYHLAALAKHWLPDPTEFDRVNVKGTKNVLTAALEAGVGRVVFTSTAGVFGSAEPGNPINERSPLSDQPASRYEQSKQACEPIVAEFQSKGLDIVTLYPARVYGPGKMNTSNVLSDIFSRFLDGNWRFIPGNGHAIGNYVFVDDVVDALLLAMNKSPNNERYLIGGENLSFNQVVADLRSATGRSHRVFHVPGWLLSIYGYLQLAKASWLGIPPKITPAFVKKYLNNACLDCRKAESELGYSATNFEDGLEQTLGWIRLHRRPR